MGYSAIKYQEMTKYLGIFMDDKLTWKRHILEVNKKITKYIGIFGKVRHLVPKDCLIALYYAFTYSRINYGIEIYANTTAKIIKPLQITQNRILRKLQSKPFLSKVNDLYTEFSVLKLNDIHRFKLCCIVHQYIYDKGKIPESMKDIFIQHHEIHDYNTRNRYDLHASIMNTKTYSSKKISYQARNFWNPLPKKLKDISTINRFKNELRAYILSEY